MQLLQVRLVRIGPFEDVTLSLADASGSPRRLAVILGAGGVGKTTLLSAIASTRPGSAVPPRPRPGSAVPSFAVCDWMLGDDDPARPHPLRSASPNAVLEESEEEALLRRREQALFDRRAHEGGFVLVGFSAARTMTRSPVAYGASDRVATFRYDARTPVVFDDVGRGDLARETKHTLGLAAISAALGGNATLDHALREVAAQVAALTGVSYVGVDPTSLEPMFEAEHRARVPFDELPTGARTVLAFGVLTARALHAAYPGRAPRDAEGVILIDEIELHQEPSVARAVVPTLRGLFPRAQWIVSTSSPQVALGCEASDVLALRRMPASSQVEIHEGPLAVIH
jgi:hypothetical protein